MLGGSGRYYHCNRSVNMPQVLSLHSTRTAQANTEARPRRQSKREVTDCMEQPSVAIISAATALIAVVVGPISAYLIAKRQITATVVSTNRQAWINQLRDHLSQLHSLLFRLPMALKIPGGILTGQQGSGLFDRYNAALDEAALLRAKIVLMLNPKEPPHVDLAQLLDKALSAASEAAISESQPKLDELLGYREQLTSMSQKILKAEWVRVKAGK